MTPLFREHPRLTRRAPRCSQCLQPEGRGPGFINFVEEGRAFQEHPFTETTWNAGEGACEGGNGAGSWGGGRTDVPSLPV